MTVDRTQPAIVRYLAEDPAFAGIGYVTADRLQSALGGELPRVLGDGDVPRVAPVTGVERAERLVAAWRNRYRRRPCAEPFCFGPDFGTASFLPVPLHGVQLLPVAAGSSVPSGRSVSTRASDGRLPGAVGCVIRRMIWSADGIIFSDVLPSLWSGVSASFPVL
ncbi:hypothetical protein VQ02_26205 [Methylobacterium variabile]|uniref:RecD helicase-like helix-hairpin-helix domain-containing protein n=1 Tax=Methylobacterium variabile TaxID=298794 RepID=A0A0J6UY60_9HYPH|nr:hypothetical protein [Methylobacterium variabile]KMO31321.1 hypothetical protein VQ02_26205 [Methylobacterium variabile]